MDVGADGRAKPSAIANALQEAAREHAHHLGWGVETLRTKRKYWVLSRIHIQLDSRPKHAEVIEVTTWPKGTTGLFALRDFIGKVKGETVLKGTSSWALLDASSGRPTSVEELSDLFTERKDEHALDEPAVKITAPKSFYSERLIAPLYTDLDEIGHVNNARYIDWAWSGLKNEDRRKVTGWTVNYIREVKEGQPLKLRIGQIESEAICVGQIENKPAFIVSFSL